MPTCNKCNLDKQLDEFYAKGTGFIYKTCKKCILEVNKLYRKKNNDYIYQKNQEWLKRNQSLMYHFENDLSKLNEDFNSNFVTKQGEHPLIIRLYLGGGICLETLVILCDMVGCINHWNKELKDDFIWQELENKITKYKPFLHYDKEKVRNICLTNFDL